MYIGCTIIIYVLHIIYKYIYPISYHIITKALLVGLLTELRIEPKCLYICYSPTRGTSAIEHGHWGGCGARDW